VPRPANPEVRRRLLEAGVTMLHANGFHGSGVQQITDRAGIPKGSFYAYFPSKEDFAAAVLAHYWNGIRRTHGPLLQRTGDLEKVLRTYFHALADDHSTRDFTLGCLVANLALECAGSSAAAAAQLRSILHDWEGQITDCLTRHESVRDVVDDGSARERAAVLIEAWEGAVIRGKIEGSRAPYDRFETQTLPRLLNAATFA
jgi:TetR/AcrR family transcriptional repressor of nem operon